jgi:hypothetical protein
MAFALRRDAVRSPRKGEASAALWQALRAAAEPASIAELHKATGVHPNTAQLRLLRWVRAGLAEELAVKPKRFLMRPDAPAQPPTVNASGRLGRHRTANERIWSAIRVCKSFDLPTLQMSSQASRRSIETFLNALQRAGVVRIVKRGNSMRGDWSTYALAQNLGPKTPRVSWEQFDGERRRALVDPNTGRIIDISPAAVSLRSNDAGRQSLGVNHVR